MVITVQITPDGKATEMSSEEADAQKGERQRILQGSQIIAGALCQGVNRPTGALAVMAY